MMVKNMSDIKAFKKLIPDVTREVNRRLLDG